MSKASRGPEADPPRAVVLGLAGPALTAEERGFFAESDPLGFILFARNCIDPDQIKALCRDLRDAVGRPGAPILIDQEGGRVARLTPPHWRQAPPAARFGALYADDRQRGIEAARLNASLIAAELHALGIDVDCAPVLDVPVPGSHEIVGDRAFSDDPDVVAALGRAALDGFLDLGVMPVVKHIPGHGRATADSHESLPRVDASLDDLRANDFKPFAALSDAPWAMTAHVVYDAIDPANPATTSSTAIADVIRGEIGFDGVLISDDLSMKAMTGGFDERAASALEAGCDLVLHCNGDMAEMIPVVKGTAPLAASAQHRLERANERRKAVDRVDEIEMLAQLDALMNMS